MQVEHVARERLAARRAAQQQHDLAVGQRLLIEVVVHDDDMAALVAQALAHGSAGVARQKLHRRFGGGRSRHHDAVGHGAGALELLHHRFHRRLLLANGHVDADDLILVGGIAVACVGLVDDGVDAERGLAGLAVADDQLTLAAPNRDHGVDCLDAGLQRLFHRLALRHRGRAAFDRAVVVVGNAEGALAVHRAAQRVHHAADHCKAGGHRDHPPGGLDGVALLDQGVRAQEHGTDVVFLQVQRHAEHPVGELQQLAHHALVEAVNACNAVTDLQDGANVRLLHLTLKALDLLLEDARDFGRF